MTVEVEDDALVPELVTCDPHELQSGPPFSELFPINPAVRRRVTESMRRRGFDMSEPIVVWRQCNQIVDGHTRWDAAIQAKIEVLVCFKDFDDVEDALLYAIARQKDRRNLTDAELVRCVEALDRRKKPGSEPGGHGNQYKRGVGANAPTPKNGSAAVTAAATGTSPDQVKRIRYINDHGSEEIKKDLDDGRISIHKAWELTKELVKAAKSTIGPPDHGANGTAVPPRPVVAQPDPVVTGQSSVSPVDEKRGLPDPDSEPDPDAAWLASFRIRSRLAYPHRFDDDARIYRHFAPMLSRIRDELKAAVGVRSDVGMSLIYRKLHKLAGIVPIERWEVCSHCNGTCVNGKVCGHCRGGGYVIPGL